MVYIKEHVIVVLSILVRLKEISKPDWMNSKDRYQKSIDTELAELCVQNRHSIQERILNSSLRTEREMPRLLWTTHLHEGLVRKHIPSNEKYLGIFQSNLFLRRAVQQLSFWTLSVFTLLLRSKHNSYKYTLYLLVFSQYSVRTTWRKPSKTKHLQSFKIKKTWKKYEFVVRLIKLKYILFNSLCY